MPSFALFLLADVIFAMAAASEHQFSSDLFGVIAKEHADENVILSPLSIELCLGLVYMGVEGSTAAQLAKGLRLNKSTDKTEVAEHFAKVFAYVENIDSPYVQLKLANRAYIGNGYLVAPPFKQLATTHFGSKVEYVDFAESKAAADEINAWVDWKTDHKIKDLVDPRSFDESTASVWVTGIYLNATWLYEFKESPTEKRDFNRSSTSKIQVDMMYLKDNFDYADLKELDAKAVELEYYGSDISMIIILPNEVDGLAALEGKLKSVNLTQLFESFKDEEVRLSLPKFKVEYDLSLRPVLEKLGIREIFTDAADFRSLLVSPKPFSVSDVKHKAFIEVNEEGTEDTDATHAHIGEISSRINSEVFDFVVDHPFVFAIKDNDYMYFIGHVINPQ